MKKRASALILALIVLLGTASCGNGGRGAENSETTTTTAATTNLNELDNEVDWQNMADIDEVDVKNEGGTGPLYESGKKSGNGKRFMLLRPRFHTARACGASCTEIRRNYCNRDNFKRKRLFRPSRRSYHKR